MIVEISIRSLLLGVSIAFLTVGALPAGTAIVTTAPCQACTPLQEVDECISALSKKIAALKASAPALQGRLKKAEADFEKKPKPPAGYMNICPDPAVGHAFDAILRQKRELEDTQKELAEMKKLRKGLVTREK
jgi:hypothetical protein